MSFSVRRHAFVLTLLGAVSLTATSSITPARQGLADAGNGAELVPAGGADATIAHDLATRASFGLSADPTLLQALKDQPVDPTLGIPLLPDEAAEMQRREVVTEALWDIDDALRPGGQIVSIWTDQASGGVVHVTVPPGGSVQSVHDYVESHLPSTTSLVVTPVDYSAIELDAVMDDERANAVDLQSAGLLVWEAGLDESLNRIVVRIEPGSDPDAEARLFQRWGARAIIIREPVDSEATVNDRYSFYPHVRAGLNIERGVTTSLRSRA